MHNQGQLSVSTDVFAGGGTNYSSKNAASLFCTQCAPGAYQSVVLSSLVLPVCPLLRFLLWLLQMLAETQQLTLTVSQLTTILWFP